MAAAPVRRASPVVRQPPLPPPKPFRPLDENWWQVFGDAELNRLENLALADNQNLAQAITRIAESRLQARIVAADLFPQLEARVQGSRSVNSDNGLVTRNSPYRDGPGETVTFQLRSTTQNSFEALANLSWEMDVFGRIRAAYAGRLARAQATVADARGVRLSLTADVATGHFALRAADAEVGILEETAGFRRENLWLNKARTDVGIGLPDDVARARLELNNVLADLADARRRRNELEKNLALLCGQPAPDFHVAARRLDDASPPPLPAAVPAGLLARRPDVAAGERLLAAALQDIREARAEELPRVTITGLVGQMSEDIEHFADRKSHEASVMPVISIPVFEGGRLEANVRLAQARRDEAAAQYKETVLTAFREADTALDDLRQRAVQAEAQRRAVADARAVLGFSNDRYDKGTASYFQVVTDQTNLLSTQLNAVRTLNARFAAAVALARALGGGWPPETVSAAAPIPAKKRPRPSK